MTGVIPAQRAAIRAWNATKAFLWDSRYPLALFALSRVALVFLSNYGLEFDPDVRVTHDPSLAPYPWIDGFCRWDCGLFAQYTSGGYRQPTDSNFWPLLPMLARVVATVTTLHPRVAVIAVSNGASLASLVVLYRLFRRIEDERAAQWAIAAFVAFPCAFFQAAGYAESLMILASALAVSWALEEKHVAAGCALGAGILARHVTILMGPSLFIAQLKQRGWRRLVSWHLVGLLIPFACVGAYGLFLQIRFGDPLAWLHARQAWGADAWRNLSDLWKQPDPRLNSYLLIALLPTIAAAALTTRRKWWELAGAAVPLCAVIWTVGLEGMGRYTASNWAAFLPIGAWLAKRPAWGTPVVLAFGMAQAFYFHYFIHQYPIH